MLLQMLIIPFIGIAWISLIYFLYFVLCEMFNLKKKIADAKYKEGVYRGMTAVNGIAYSVLTSFDREKGNELYMEILKRANDKRRFI